MTPCFEWGTHTARSRELGALQHGITRNPARTRAWSRYRELFSVDLEIAEGIETVRVTVELDEEAKERLVDAAEAMGLLEEGK